MSKDINQQDKKMYLVTNGIDKGIIISAIDADSALRIGNREFYSPFPVKERFTIVQPYEKGKSLMSGKIFENVVYHFSGDGAGRITNYDSTLEDKLNEDKLKFIGKSNIDYITFFNGTQRFKNGGEVRKMTIGDAVVYNGETWYVSEKDGVLGIKTFRQGSWGRDYPFIPISELNEEDLTDMSGNKVSIQKMENGGEIYVPESEDLSNEDIERFVDYVYDFYMEKGYSQEDVKKAVDKYLNILGKEYTWGGGDSLDRERVYEFLKNPKLTKIVNPSFAEGGVIDVIDKYNRMNLPSEIFANKKPYTGYATFINGSSGYGSSEDDGYLIGEGLYLTDENGSIIRSKERRGLTMYIEDGKFLEISSYAEGGNTNSFNPRSFSLEELTHHLGKNDIYVSWFLKGWTGITPASENKIIWDGTSNSLGYKQWKDKKLTISNYGNLEIGKGDENIYLTVVVYELQSNSEQPYEIRLYTKDNIKELKSFSKMLIDKLKDGGNLSTETREKITKLQKVVDSAMIPENVKEKARLEIEKLMEEGKGQQDDKTLGQQDFEQRELNKSVLKIVDSKRISNQDQFEQIVAEALQDANYHEQAFKFASKVDKSIKTKDDWYQSKRFIGTKTTREIGIQIAQMTGWNGDKITDALEFVLKMKGFHNLANALKDAMSVEDEYPNRIETLTKNQELYIKEIATRTATDQRAVTEFVKDNGLTETETLNLLQGLGMKKIISIDFVTALLGNKLYEQNIVAFAKSNEAFKYEPKKEETPKVADDRLKGKNISDVSTYIPHRAIEVIVTTFNGKKVTLNGADIFDGIYVDNKALGLEDNKTSRRKDGKTNDNKNVYKYQVKVNQYIPRGGNKGVDYYYVSDDKGNVINKNTGKIYRGKEMTNYKFSTNSEAQLYADKLNNKMADGGSVEKRPDFTKMSKEQLIDYSKKNNIPYALGWSKETLIEIIEDTLDSRYSDGGKVEIDSKKIGLAKRLDIKNWYLKTYPTDNLGKEINDNVSFWSLYTFMSQRYNVYSVLGVSDSIVRERVFEKLSEILGIKYDYIYKMWLKSSDEYADGGKIQSEIDNIDNRIYNLEQLRMVADVSNQEYYNNQIKNLEEEKADLMKKMESGDAPKKRGWFFKQGGQTAAQKKKIEKVMHEFKMGTLKSFSGDKVTDREQAIAIALSEAGLSKKADGGWVLYDEDSEKVIKIFKTESEARKNLYEYSGNANIVEKSVWDKQTNKMADGGGVDSYKFILIENGIKIDVANISKDKATKIQDIISKKRKGVSNGKKYESNIFENDVLIDKAIISYQTALDIQDYLNTKKSKGGWSHKSNSSKSDIKLISDKIEELNKFSGVELVADDYFKGIYEANGKKYFNVEIKDRVSESNIISKLQGTIKSKVISKVEPNGVKRLAIYF